MSRQNEASFDVFTLDLRSLISDLRKGVLGHNGYVEKLASSARLQELYREFEKEIAEF